MKFSVIVPVYNVKDYLSKCVESILNQDVTDYELLLVDDGSTDESGVLCDKICEKHPEKNIRVIHQENMGLGGARNTGIAAAQGEYLFFVDSDDSITEDALQKSSDYLEEHPDTDILVFDNLKVDEQGNVIYTNKTLQATTAYASIFEDKKLLLTDHSSCNKIIRKTLFTENDIYFPKRLWFEDLATIIRLYPHAKKIGYIPEAFYLYLQREGSIMNSTQCDRNIDMLTAYDTVLQYFKAQGLFEEFYTELEYIAAFHVYYLSSVRVMNMDKHHKLLDMYREYVHKEFPNCLNNPYLGKKEKLIISLLDKKRYNTILFIFKVKGVVNRLAK